MRALDRKLMRDLRRLWAQSLAIALVLACGVLVLVLAMSASRALTETRDTYYERNRFADIFASATRAPDTLIPDLAQLEGVARVDTRIEVSATVDLPGRVEPAMARVISLPPDGPVLNVPHLVSGRLPDPLRPAEAALSENFAKANRLGPGDRLRVVLNGQVMELVVTGLLLSPEFIYLIGPGTMMPDDRRYGLIWMGEAPLAAATDREGAFNQVSVQLVRHASADAVAAAIDVLLAPYGGTGAVGRDRQTSHAFLQSELDQLEAMALIVPPVFLVVSAFLVNMVLARLITLERSQIGLLKAVGYTSREIARHYLKMSVLIGVIGVAMGWAAGSWLGREVTQMYADFYRFPYLIYAPVPRAYLVSGLVGMGAVLLGAMRAVMASARLSPTVAMAPPAAPIFRRGWVDALGRRIGLRQTTMMILRSISRWPARAMVTLLGVAASVAVLIGSFFSLDAMAVIVDEVFYQTQRQHVSLSLYEARGSDVIEAARQLPGVLDVEGAYSLPIRLRSGAKERLVEMRAHAPEARLVRLLDRGGSPVRLPAEGIALPASLAAELALREGDVALVELLVPPRETVAVPVSAVFRQSLGQTVYMAEPALFAMLRQAPQVNQLNLLVDESALPAFHAAVKQAPAVSGLSLLPEVRRQFDATMMENLLRFVLIYSALGVLIAVGVVYNAARIQLSERAHEMATLRVLGFTRGEVGYVLVGELMLLTVLALPVGWVAGYAFAALVTRGFSTDMIEVPLVVSRQTYGLASAIVVVAAGAAALLVRRRLDGLDIAMALKRGD